MAPRKILSWSKIFNFMDFTSNSETNNTYKEYKPWLTIAFIAICVIVFTGINSERSINNWVSHRKWGSLSTYDIYDGHLWGLLTCNFFHLDFLHLLFNLYWLWIFGKKIEFEKGIFFLLFFAISTGFLVSIFQMTLTDDSGIGFSGIGYAMFGYLYIQSRYHPRYKEMLDRNTIQLFIAWLFICIILSYSGLMHIGNVAHFTGLIWGAAIAYTENTLPKFLSYFLLLLIFASSFIPVFWAPWSVGWLSYKAYNLHNAEKYQEAVSLYNSILEKDPANTFALENKKIIEVYFFQEDAQKALKENKIQLAKTYLLKIQQIDSSNTWAKDLLKDLGN
jgi:membrane associated rhomboid family serine protease